jgi:hypothetical protein
MTKESKSSDLNIEPQKKRLAKNVVWFIVDSVRNYHTDVDDRGRINIMDELANNMIEFETAITSAPSTVMSESSMFTGVPSIFHSRTYYDFDYGTSKILSVQRILKNLDYNIYNIVFFPEGRQFLKPLIGNLCEEFWPKDAKPNEFWNNDTVNDILKRLVNNGLKEPFFLFVNYNCRWDPKTSDKVNQGYSLLSKHNYLDDAAFIINSDHGYPDESRKISMYDKRKFGHDLILTDDNILTPLIIGYPNCTPKRITTPVSLLDIMPTILDMIGQSHHYKVQDFPTHGQSLLNNIENNNSIDSRFVRVDNRYIFQNQRKAALRNDRYKYIFDFSSDEEEFYDIHSDKLETKNLIKEQSYYKIIGQFREIFTQQERVIYKYHKNILKAECIKLVSSKIKTIGIIGNPNQNFILMMCDILSSIGIEQIYIEDVLDHKIQNTKSKIKINSILSENSSVDRKIDILLSIITDGNPKNHYQLRKRSEKQKADRIFYCNYNLKTRERPNFWIIPALKKSSKFLWPSLKKTPKVFLLDIILLTKKLFSNQN